MIKGNRSNKLKRAKFTFIFISKTLNLEFWNLHWNFILPIHWKDHATDFDIKYATVDGENQILSLTVKIYIYIYLNMFLSLINILCLCLIPNKFWFKVESLIK